jgi:hypothetical protein
MWARVLELLLAAWLALSPFVLRHPRARAGLWADDLACAALVGVLAACSFVPALRRAHLGSLAVAAWLAAWGWWNTRDGADPFAQNWIVCGLLLGMLAIVPSDALRPPPRWRAFRV